MNWRGGKVRKRRKQKKGRAAGTWTASKNSRKHAMCFMFHDDYSVNKYFSTSVNKYYNKDMCVFLCICALQPASSSSFLFTGMRTD